MKREQRRAQSARPARLPRGLSWAGCLRVGLALSVALGTLAAQAGPADDDFLFAYKLMQRGDLVEAGAAFDTFLEKFPNDDARGDALYFRAALYRKAGAQQAAADVLAAITPRTAPRRVPAYVVALLRGQVLTDLGRYDDAVAELEKIDPARLPQDAVASTHLLKGLAYRGAGNFEAAAAALDRAATLETPLRPRALLEGARALAGGGDAPAALAVLGSLLALDDDATRAEAARYAGDLSYAAGDTAAAAGYYTRVIERDQSSPQFGPAVVGRMWADLAAGNNVAVVSAHQQLADGLVSADAAAADYVAASAYQGLSQQARAAELLTGYVAGGDTQPLQSLALYKLAVSQFELARYDDMVTTVAHLERAFPDSEQQIDASFLLASADAKRGDAASGVARLNTFVQAGKDGPYYLQALLRRAALYESEGADDAARNDLKQWLTDAGKPLNEAAGPALRLVSLHHRLGDYEAAAALAGELLEAKPAPASEQEALFRRGEALTRAGKLREALVAYDRLQKDHPINPHREAVGLRRGLLLGKLGRGDESLATLNASADNERLPVAQRGAALRVIAAQHRDGGRPDAAATALERVEALQGLASLDDADLLWLASHRLDRGAADRALEVLGVFSEPGRKLTGPAESQLLYVSGRAHLARGDLDAAHRSFFGVVALGQGFDVEARLELARVAAARGDLDGALVELSDLTRSENAITAARALYETGRVHRLRAQRLTRDGDAAGAAAALAEARSPIKRMVVLYLTVEAVQPLPQAGLVELVEIAEALGDDAAAAREREELTRRFEDTPHGRYAGAMRAWRERDRPDDALAALTRLRDDGGLPQDLGPRVDTAVAKLEALRR